MHLWQVAVVFLSGSVFTIVLLTLGMGIGEQRSGKSDGHD